MVLRGEFSVVTTSDTESALVVITDLLLLLLLLMISPIIGDYSIYISPINNTVHFPCYFPRYSMSSNLGIAPYIPYYV